MESYYQEPTQEDIQREFEIELTNAVNFYEDIDGACEYLKGLSQDHKITEMAQVKAGEVPPVIMAFAKVVDKIKQTTVTDAEFNEKFHIWSAGYDKMIEERRRYS